MQAEIIPEYFSLKRMSSFVRQLHLYDFHKDKTHSRNGVLAFHNDLFQKDHMFVLVLCRDLAVMIRRKRKTKKEKEIEKKKTEKTIEFHPNHSEIDQYF